MKPAEVKLRTYTCELVKVLGTVNIVVGYEGNTTAITKRQIVFFLVDYSNSHILNTTQQHSS